MNNIALKVHVLTTTDFTQACAEAIELSKRMMMAVQFDFNGCPVTVRAHSKLEHLVNYYETYQQIKAE